MPLDSDQLEAFWEVSQALNYRRAAEALFITQSAVTQRIQALEATLGLRLFMRKGRGIELTSAGHTLQRYCRDHRQAEAELLSTLTGKGGGLAGRLAVASGSAEGRRWVLPLMAELGREHPHLDLQLILDDALDPISLLESGRVDAVLSEIPLRRNGIRSLKLGVTEYALVASIELRLGEAPSAERLKRERAIDFGPHDRITLDHLAHCLPEADFSDLRRHFVNDTRSILDWVLAGGGFSVLPTATLNRVLQDGTLQLLYPTVKSSRQLYWAAHENTPSAAVGMLAARLAAQLIS